MSRIPDWRVLTLIGALHFLQACTGFFADAEVRYPAQVPLRVFPQVFVAADDDASAISLAASLVEHLQAGEIEARRVRTADVPAMRVRGELPNTSAVLRIELQLRQGTVALEHTRPEMVCGAAGCFSRRNQTMMDSPTLEGRMRLQVEAGPTGRVLQQHRVQKFEQGRTYATMRERVLDALRTELQTLVDESTHTISVHFFELSGHEDAVEAIQAGDWHQARRLLEGVVDVASEENPRALYNLGLARRFDPRTLELDPERHFRLSEEALLQAVQLEPDAIYHEALADMRRHRDGYAQLQAQQAAREHNFAMESEAPPTAGGEAPAPPPAYR